LPGDSGFIWIPILTVNRKLEKRTSKVKITVDQDSSSSNDGTTSDSRSVSSAEPQRRHTWASMPESLGADGPKLSTSSPSEFNNALEAADIDDSGKGSTMESISASLSSNAVDSFGSADGLDYKALEKVTEIQDDSEFYKLLDKMPILGESAITFLCTESNLLFSIKKETQLYLKHGDSLKFVKDLVIECLLCNYSGKNDFADIEKALEKCKTSLNAVESLNM
jgi:hypothetical protein